MINQDRIHDECGLKSFLIRTELMMNPDLSN
jgi:hypothetical protein